MKRRVFLTTGLTLIAAELFEKRAFAITQERYKEKRSMPILVLTGSL